MKRKLLAIIVFVILCISSFSFAGEEDFPIALKSTDNDSIVFERISSNRNNQNNM